MISHFNEKTSFVLGYGGYLKQRGLLNTYIRYDTVIIAMQYLGMAIRGIPYMGVGRNLAYRRSVLLQTRDFGSHTTLHLAMMIFLLTKMPCRKYMCGIQSLKHIQGQSRVQISMNGLLRKKDISQLLHIINRGINFF